MKNNTIKTRLAAMSFLEFGVWGAYLISMGQFLAANGLGTEIFWFYTIQGIVSIFMPAVMGIIADRWIPAQKTFALCHVLAGAFMIASGIAAWQNISVGEAIDFAKVFPLYTLSVAFYMPTVALGNSVAFNALAKYGLSSVTDFPPIRTLGTVGFICAEVAVSFISIGGEEIQNSVWQWYLSGGLSILLALYSLTLPNCPCNTGVKKSLADSLGLSAFKLFKHRDMAIFFIFSMLLGVSLQITNAYGSDFIRFFAQIPEYANGFLDGWFAHKSVLLISVSQCAEAVCILLIPYCLKRFGIKGVMLVAMFAWMLRFFLFGIGDTNFPGVIWLFLSCVVYGVAFDFFNVSGGIFVELRAEPAQRSSAQGLFMLMTNGIGASIGTFIAGKYVVNNLVLRDASVQEQLVGWHHSWLIFAAYALVVAILFMIIFREPKKQESAEN